MANGVWVFVRQHEGRRLTHDRQARASAPPEPSFNEILIKRQNTGLAPRRQDQIVYPFRLLGISAGPKRSGPNNAAREPSIRTLRRLRIVGLFVIKCPES
jgi:hypothetical protein